MTDYFIKIGSHKGESKDSTLKEWIDVLSWSMGASQSASAHSQGGAGVNVVTLQDFSFTKHLDLSTNPVLLDLCNGKHIPKIEFKARKAGGSPFVYLTLTFSDSIMSHFSTGGGGDYPTENWGFSFAKIESKYDMQGATGKSAGDNKMTYDIKLKKGS